LNQYLFSYPLVGKASSHSCPLQLQLPLMTGVVLSGLALSYPQT